MVLLPYRDRLERLALSPAPASISAKAAEIQPGPDSLLLEAPGAVSVSSHQGPSRMAKGPALWLPRLSLETQPGAGGSDTP